jgi:hypothetical protein
MFHAGDHLATRRGCDEKLIVGCFQKCDALQVGLQANLLLFYTHCGDILQSRVMHITIKYISR